MLHFYFDLTLSITYKLFFCYIVLCHINLSKRLISETKQKGPNCQTLTNHKVTTTTSSSAVGHSTGCSLSRGIQIRTVCSAAVE